MHKNHKSPLRTLIFNAIDRLLISQKRHKKSSKKNFTLPKNAPPTLLHSRLIALQADYCTPPIAQRIPNGSQTDPKHLTRAPTTATE